MRDLIQSKYKTRARARTARGQKHAHLRFTKHNVFIHYSHIEFNVKPMSERGSATKPISVYLSPKASNILTAYVNNSGYGSTSRTVEEMILSYNASYNAMLSWLLSLKTTNFQPDPNATLAFILTLLGTFDLANGTSIETAAKNVLNTAFYNKFGVNVIE